MNKIGTDQLPSGCCRSNKERCAASRRESHRSIVPDPFPEHASDETPNAVQIFARRWASVSARRLTWLQVPRTLTSLTQQATESWRQHSTQLPFHRFIDFAVRFVHRGRDHVLKHFDVAV